MKRLFLSSLLINLYYCSKFCLVLLVTYFIVFRAFSLFLTSPLYRHRVVLTSCSLTGGCRLVLQLDLHESKQRLASGAARGGEETSNLKKQLEEQKKQLEEQRRRLDEFRKGADQRTRQLEERERALADMEDKLKKRREKIDQMEQAIQKVLTAALPFRALKLPFGQEDVFYNCMFRPAAGRGGSGRGGRFGRPAAQGARDAAAAPGAPEAVGGRQGGVAAVVCRDGEAPAARADEPGGAEQQGQADPRPARVSVLFAPSHSIRLCFPCPDPVRSFSHRALKAAQAKLRASGPAAAAQQLKEEVLYRWHAPHSQCSMLLCVV